MSVTERESRILELFEEATQAPEGTLSRDLVLKDMEGWDSMGMVMFIGLVQQYLTVELSVHDLRDSGTIAELAARIMEKGGA
jgi:acyl carrier protein